MIKLANPEYLYNQALAEVLRPPPPPTIESLQSDVLDPEIAQCDILNAFWRLGGDEGRAWIKQNHRHFVPGEG